MRLIFNTIGKDFRCPIVFAQAPRRLHHRPRRHRCDPWLGHRPGQHLEVPLAHRHYGRHWVQGHRTIRRDQRLRFTRPIVRLAPLGRLGRGLEQVSQPTHLGLQSAHFRGQALGLRLPTRRCGRVRWLLTGSHAAVLRPFQHPPPIGRPDAVIRTVDEYPGIVLAAEWETYALSVFGEHRELEKLWTAADAQPHADAFRFTYCPVESLYDVIRWVCGPGSTRPLPRRPGKYGPSDPPVAGADARNEAGLPDRRRPPLHPTLLPGRRHWPWCCTWAIASRSTSISSHRPLMRFGPTNGLRCVWLLTTPAWRSASTRT